MLRDWKIKFPQCFAEYSTFFTSLTQSDEACLSRLLAMVERSDLLDEETVRCLLDKSCDQLHELAYWVDKLAELHCLNRATLQDIFGAYSLADLKEHVGYLAEHGLAPGDFKHVLSQQGALNSLSRAIPLFDLGGLDYHEHAQAFIVLAETFANPLCQTIFDARLRAFSDYSVPSDPVNLYIAGDIIQKLRVLPDEESRIHTFFDFFASHRPFPESQKYIVEVDVAAEVAMALESYCVSVIKAIASPEDYERARRVIRKLQTEGGDKVIFDKIKYSVASAIESQDWCSTRHYAQLMDEVWQELVKPQADLDSFIKELESSKGYRQMTMIAMRGRALLMTPSTMDQPAIDDVNETRLDLLHKS